MSPELPQALQVALRVIEVLEEMGISYHLGGSYASSIHGVPRQTQDIDLVAELTPDSAGALTRRLDVEFYVDEATARSAARDHGSFNLIHLETAMKVDVFVRGDAPFDVEEFRRHREETVDVQSGRRVFVKTPEDTLLRKLQWYRLGGEVSDRQWGDVVGIARTQGERLDRAHLRRWAPVLGVEDLLARLLGSE